VNKKLDIIQTLNNLNKIKRTGPSLGAGIPQHDIESLAEHSYRVVYLCLIFSKADSTINLLNLIQYVITHEWGECILGDLPLRGKSYMSYFRNPMEFKNAFREAEGKAKQMLMKDAGIGYVSLSASEDKLFRFCDTLARIVEIIDYRQTGYKSSWLDKMYKVQISLLKKYAYSFVNELLAGIDEIYQRGYMENKYLTKETDKDQKKE